MISHVEIVAIAQRVVVIATVRYDMINRVEVALDALKSTQSRDAMNKSSPSHDAIAKSSPSHDAIAKSSPSRDAIAKPLPSRNAKTRGACR